MAECWAGLSDADAAGEAHKKAFDNEGFGCFPDDAEEKKEDGEAAEGAEERRVGEESTAGCGCRWAAEG